MTLRKLIAIASLGTALGLAACNSDQGTVAEKTCQAVAAELMRSPESMKVVSRIGHGSEVFIDARAANAYGTEVRASISCQMNGGQDSDDVASVIMDGEEVHPYAVLAASVRVRNAKRMKNIK